MEHGFQVIDDSTAAAHAMSGNNDGRPSGSGLALARCFRSLVQAAADQQAVLGIHKQLMAGAGHAIFGAMEEDIGVAHASNPC